MQFNPDKCEVIRIRHQQKEFPHPQVPHPLAGPHSAVGNLSGNRCKSDCRSRGREFDPGSVPYFCGD